MKVPNCPICKSDDTFIFHDKVWLIEGCQVFRCKICDTTFIHPTMDDVEERSFYSNYNEHVKKRGVTVTSDPIELHTKSQPIAAERYRIINDYLNDNLSVIEIGSSTGAFLELLSNPLKVAVEPDNVNREFCNRFVKTVYSDICEVPQQFKFDIACMFHVFEHIRDPFLFLSNLKKLLKNGAKILVEVPNIDDPLIQLYQCNAFKDFYFQPMHPYVYSINSLDFIFSHCGFKRERVIFYQRYGLDNHLTWLCQSKPGGDLKFEKLFNNNLSYKQSLEDAHITDTLFYIAEVNDEA